MLWYCYMILSTRKKIKTINDNGVYFEFVGTVVYDL